MKIFGIAGYSGSGKTTLIEKLIPIFVARRTKVSLIKHAHHSFDVDQPGKDSYRHREAGCTEVLVASGLRWALMHELRGAPEPTLGELIGHISACDLLLVEGFKREPIVKLEVYRKMLAEPVLFPQDPRIIAIASDEYVDTQLPQFNLDEIGAIADFIETHAAPYPA
jgi:molybdopterin-guanine dinucleotide biosynthesis protein B